jgi:O-antigen ligase
VGSPALPAERLGTAWPPSPAIPGAALAAGAIVLFAAADGGVAPAASSTGAIVLGAVAVGLSLWAPARPTWGRLLPLVPLAAYAMLSLGSTTWSADRSASLVDTQRTLLYVVAAAGFLLARRGLAAGVVTGATAVAAWALGARVLVGAPVDRYEGKLLIGPIGYANGLGALMAVGAAVTAAFALRERRLLLASPLALLLPALALTNSRGSILALGAGIAVAALVTAGRRVAAGFVVVAAAALLTSVLVSSPRWMGDRAHYWSAARSTAGEHPFTGTGAGTFGIVHVQAPYARDAHSLYLQALAELGVGGLALIVAIVAVPLALAVRRGLAAPAAGLTVFALHAGIDWDWQLPAVTLAAFALAAAAGPYAGAGLRDHATRAAQRGVAAAHSRFAWSSIASRRV